MVSKNMDEPWSNDHLTSNMREADGDEAEDDAAGVLLGSNISIVGPEGSGLVGQKGSVVAWDVKKGHYRVDLGHHKVSIEGRWLELQPKDGAGNGGSSGRVSGAPAEEEDSDSESEGSYVDEGDDDRDDSDDKDESGGFLRFSINFLVPDGKLHASLCPAGGARARVGGVVVHVVNEDAPSARAGLRAGDMIVGIDGENVPQCSVFNTAHSKIKSHLAALVEGGADSSITIDICRLDKSGGFVRFSLNVAVPDGKLHAILCPAHGARASVGSVVVYKVLKDGPSARAGLRVGDVIVGIDGESFSQVWCSPGDFYAEAAVIESRLAVYAEPGRVGSRVTLDILRHVYDEKSRILEDQDARRLVTRLFDASIRLDGGGDRDDPAETGENELPPRKGSQLLRRKSRRSAHGTVVVIIREPWSMLASKKE